MRRYEGYKRHWAEEISWGGSKALCPCLFYPLHSLLPRRGTLVDGDRGRTCEVAGEARAMPSMGGCGASGDALSSKLGTLAQPLSMKNTNSPILTLTYITHMNSYILMGDNNDGKKRCLARCKIVPPTSLVLGKTHMTSGIKHTKN